ncbi:hypothetical protein BGZ63DRAFT_427308 [Mariannaea sp. PMI_226]|nr:hypothetical protein BGZ63DRAFT_427308 [Mariannaea sp. PMI_226]
MRLKHGCSLSFSSLLYAFTLLIAIAAAFDSGPRNRPINANASPLVSNGIASQVPQDRLASSHIRHHTLAPPRRVRKPSSSSIDAAAGPHNVKAVTHVGINFLTDLISPSNLIGSLISNSTIKLFTPEDVISDGGAASPRRKIVGMSIALTLVMVFFIVWM